MTSDPALTSIALLGAFAAVGLLRGILFTLGKDRSLARGYFDHTKPIQTRNLAFALLPLSVGMLALLLVGPAQQLVQQGRSPATFLLLMTAGIALFVAARSVLDPPEVLKPTWLRTQEESAGGPHGADDSRIDRAIVRAVGLVGAALAVLAGSLLLLTIAMLASGST